jgi:hypothetical protein
MHWCICTTAPTLLPQAALSGNVQAPSPPATIPAQPGWAAVTAG